MKVKNIKIFIIAAIAIVFLFAILLIVGAGLKTYSLQYNWKGTDKFVRYDYNSDIAQVEVGELDGYTLVIENMENVHFITFSADRISLDEAIETKVISLDDLLSVSLSSSEDNTYEFENYVIILQDDQCLIKAKYGE